MSEIEKTPPPRRGRFAFMRTKRAIFLLTALVIVSAVLIALGATHVLTPNNNIHSVSSESNSVGSNAGNAPGNSVGGDGVSSGDNNAGTVPNDPSVVDDNGMNNGTDTTVGDNDNSDKDDGKDSGKDDKDGKASNKDDGKDDSKNDDSKSDGKDDDKSDGKDSKDGKDDDKDDGKTSGKGDDKTPSKTDSQDDGQDGTEKSSTWKPANSSTIAAGTPLRIMCLGASIVRGEVSTDQNGFRKTLRDALSGLGAPVNMVGTQFRGNMADNEFEAYGGNRISQIHAHAEDIVPEEKPNVFVINVGTNNVLQRVDLDVAGEHMGAFIDYLLKASPRSTVVLSTLLTNTVPNREPLILDLNRQFRALFREKYADKPVVLAELHPSSGLPGRPTTGDISGDGSHPNDNGYVIMGQILADAVLYADSKNYLRWPENGLPYDGDKENEKKGGEEKKTTRSSLSARRM